MDIASNNVKRLMSKIFQFSTQVFVQTHLSLILTHTHTHTHTYTHTHIYTHTHYHPRIHKVFRF